jgi:Cd2+/Zn2+-exporting ATPase
VRGAVALAVVPPLVRLATGRAPGRNWIYRALTFLVISCPCALVISIPLSFFGGIGGASAARHPRQGLELPRGAGQNETVVFDKTGTLTKGNFKVTAVMPRGGLGQEDSAGDGRAGRELFRPPDQRCPCAPRRNRAVDKSARVTDVEELGGHGVTATVDGKTVARATAR